MFSMWITTSQGSTLNARLREASVRPDPVGRCGAATAETAGSVVLHVQDEPEPRRWLATRSPHTAFRGLARALCAVALTLSTACGRSSVEPSDPYAGGWTGTLQDDQMGSGRLTITLSDTVNLAGSWTAEVGGTALSGSMSLSPSFAGDPTRRFAMTCGTAPPGGSVLFTPSLEGSMLQGPYLGLGCGNLTRGTARLTRR